MSAADVLAQARAAGVELLIHDGRLASRGPVTAELQAAIRAHKSELAALLTCEPCERPVNPASVDIPVAWIDRPDVSTVVEDLADEGWRAGRIAHELGLTRAEVINVLRRTGR